MNVLGIAGAVLLILTVTKAVSPRRFRILPLGGSAIAEMGIVFGTAIAVISIIQAIGDSGAY